MKRITILLASILVLGLIAAPAFAGGGYGNGHDPVTICHRTNSDTNPYVVITVDDDAVDGVAGNSGNQPDHYGEHVGPVWELGLKDQKIEWGDIIPPVTDEGYPLPHNGRNWSEEGQAIYNNGCKPVEDEPVELEFSVIPPTPECAPWTPVWTLVVPEFEGTLYAFFSDGGDGFARTLVSGQNETLESEQPITEDSFFSVSVETPEGEVLFLYQNLVSPSDEGCTTTTTSPPEDTTTTSPPEDTTTTSEPNVEGTSTTVAPTPTTTAPAPDGGDEGSFPLVPVAFGAALLIASLIGLATRQQEQ